MRLRSPLGSATGLLALLAAALSSPASASAEGLRIEPGQWEFTSSTPSPMGGKPERRTTTDCVRDEEMKPQFFTAQMQGCKVTDPKSDASSMSWTLTCPSPAGTMIGKGQFRSTGTTMSGSVDVTMTVSGQKHESRSTWEGRRTGDCR